MPACHAPQTPTSKIEASFKSLAQGLGVDVRTGVRVEDVYTLDRFPHARYIIGADGRRSVVREQRFGGKLTQDYSVMRIVFAKYRVRAALSMGVCRGGGGRPFTTIILRTS